MLVQMVSGTPSNFEPMSQYQQYGASPQSSNGVFMMQPMPMSYQAQQTSMTSKQQDNGVPMRPPGVFNMQSRPCDVGQPYQTPMPQDQDSQQNPNGMVMMQPVFMPYYDHCAVQMPMSTEKVDAQTQGWSAPKSQKWKQGGASARKKLPGAVRPEEVEELKLAMQQAMTANLKRGISQSTCSTTGEGLSDGEVHNDSADGSSRTPSEAAAPEAVACFTDTMDTALLDLDSNDDKKRQRVCQWVLESFWPLALSKRGCRVVQKAMDVGTPAYLLQLLENLRGYVHDAMQSLHANYVLQKFIEMVTPERIHFIVTELQENALDVARHRFGCRIMQRLLEHCAPWQTEQLVNNVLADAAALCRHQYGNFILQHILQYGSPSQKSVIAEVVLADIFRHAKHRLASHILQCALVHCSSDDIRRLTQAVLRDEGQLYQLSRREYGSFVVREVNRAAQKLERNKNGEEPAPQEVNTECRHNDNEDGSD